jgi:hypothetical protein
MKKRRRQARDDARSVFGFGVGHVTWLDWLLLLVVQKHEHRRAERGARPIYLTHSELTFRGRGRPEVLGQVKSQ